MTKAYISNGKLQSSVSMCSSFVPEKTCLFVLHNWKQDGYLNSNRTLMKHLEKKLDKNFSSVLLAVLNKAVPYKIVVVQPLTSYLTKVFNCPVSWGCRIHWLHLGWGVRPPLTSVLDMTLNNLMVRFQQCWSFGECGVPLHCHCSQVYSGPE